MMTDPLIAAAIGKLPPPGEAWPAEQRRAWLKLIELALDVVYGAGEAMPTDLPKISLRGAAQGTRSIALPDEPPPKKSDPPFYIDEQGYARQENGDRILPGDVAGPIYDKRGEFGDLAGIIWADETRGTQGYQLDISTSV